MSVRRPLILAPQGVPIQATIVWEAAPDYAIRFAPNTPLPVPTDRTGAHFYGQSLTLGTDVTAAALITGAAVSGSFMANGGVRVHYDEPGRTNPNQPMEGTQFTSLVALQEQVNPNDSQMQETFASGLATRSSYDLVATVTGRGAYTIDQLRPIDGEDTGWFHFANTLSAIEHSKRLTEDAGETYGLGPMIFIQGAADALNNTAPADWKTGILALHQEFVDCIPAQTGIEMPFNWKMIIDQQGMGQNSTTYAELAVAAIELHREHPDKFACVGPRYPLAHCNSGADVHLLSNTSRNYGEKIKEAFDAVVAAIGWDPCHITDVQRSGTTITVTVHVPVPPLVFDTSLITAIDNHGFNHTVASITNVDITDDGTGTNTGTIEIELDAAVSGDLEYAYHNNTINVRAGPVNGPRGTVRDSSAFTTTNDSTAMPNFLCVDKWTVA